MVVAANTSTTQSQSVYVLVDRSLNPPGAALDLLLSNRAPARVPDAVAEQNGQRAVRVTLQPMEAQVIGRAR